MNRLPIFKFIPRYAEVVWGGRSLQTVLNKNLPSDVPVGESWEICDLPDYQSVVAEGSLKGESLEKVIRDNGDLLLGKTDLLHGRFPLLFKYIDAKQKLSVQVHPDDDACKKIAGGARPKTEAWYIIECAEDAVLYVGLKKGVTRKDFERALSDGSVEFLLHKKPVKPGDYIFLPSGTLHAIGSDILLAEVQQSSNTTYRAFDWNRTGLDGKPRELHIEQALESIHFDEFEEPVITPPDSGRPGVKCDYFSMETVVLNDNDSQDFEFEIPVAIMGVNGKGTLTVTCEDEITALKCGETVLIPAHLSGNVKVEAKDNITLVLTQIY
ncbi:MAG: class I mannose-6-phosphate isomerase [Deltaproteobacteria bacterium]|nr:class I mannose-6-phosphate isomerase [Deltaproteobacteria bacterium]